MGRSLLFDYRFWPLFWVQFLGAFCDNLFKNALLILVTFQLAEQMTLDAKVLAPLAAALLIAPFFLFSGIAGQLIDRFEKTFIIRRLKLIELGLMTFAGLSLIVESVPMMMVVLFLIGTQATFLGPIKYAILPQILKDHELIEGNGLIEAGTFLAILMGTICGGALVIIDHGFFAGNGVEIVCAMMITLSVLGLGFSYLIRPVPISDPTLKIAWNIWRASAPIIAEAWRSKVLFRSMLGISWLWFVGAIFINLFPSYVHDILHAERGLATFFMAAFSVGIAVGSVLCHRLLHNEISAKYVPLGALGMALFGVLVAVFSQGYHQHENIHAIAEFMGHSQSWLLMGSMFALAVCGGIFSVPLYALIQANCQPERRARMIAANNIVNAFIIILSSLFAVSLLSLGFSITDVFAATALLSIAVAIYTCVLVPQPVIRGLFYNILQLAFSVRVHGLENAPKGNVRAVYVANHVSFIDGILLATYLPGNPVFAVNTFIARKWWAKLFLTAVDYFPIDPTNPMSIKSLIHLVEGGRPLVIFPEGRLTQTGALMKIYEGPGLIADKARAPVIPVRIDGVQYTPFSYLRGKVRQRWFPPITLTILKPVDLRLPVDLRGRNRRVAASDTLYNIMSEMMFATCRIDQPLFLALVDAMAIAGSRTIILEDIERHPMTYRQFLRAVLALGRRIALETEEEGCIGVMLPNIAGSPLTFFALQAFGKVPAMINFSAGISNVQAACTAATLKTIITSRTFVTKAKLDPLVQGLTAQVRFLYLEDLRDKISTGDKINAVIDSVFPRLFFRRFGVRAEDPAVVLFTSGSEGVPKGVVLSHRNLQANRYQLAARIDFNAADTVFNVLPLFHSFGLTGGMLLPLLSGVKVFLYPSPLHYRIVPELVYDTNATILFGTDTFLAGYARMANPYDFYSVRYVFAGAEKVKEETRRVWSEKFRLSVLEGYGATETAPALAMNTPMHAKSGTVGRLLPGIDYKLEQIPGIEKGGRLIVKGPNIMLGYLKVEAPGLLQPPLDGWYDTGDIVSIDARGFVTIEGRAKRFAKIAGEMVSLTSVEGFIQAAWPDYHHAVIAVADERKGEQLVLFTTAPALTREELTAAARAKGLSELAVPRQAVVLPALPLLGTGKVDYAALTQMCRSL